jgi:hypothetical protein
MSDLSSVAPAFVEMAHRIVWATVATVDSQGRPRSRILHPYWSWDGTALTGRIATSPTPVKRAHLGRSPFVSVTYWAPGHDTCTAECRATWILDDAGREDVWRLFAEAPQPVGYNPADVPPWAGGPTSPAFAGLRLEPWRLRVMAGSVMLSQVGDVLTWAADPGDA